jgi:single-strand DNA-binding protein
MASFNRVILVGNVTRDVELRYTPSSLAVCDIGLAVNDRRKTATGEWVDETTFVDISMFGRTAEVAGEYLKKGSPVLIEGRLKLDQWETNDGQKRSKLKVICDKMQLLGSKGEGGGGGGGSRRGGGASGGGGGGDDYYDDAPPQESFRPQASGGGRGQPQPPAGGDDIPF